MLLYGLTWILSIIKLPKYFDTYLKFIPIIIGYTLFNEILGALVYNIEDFTFFTEAKYSFYTLFIYNLYDLIFFPFFLYVYWKSVPNEITKNVIGLGAILFVLVLVINSLFVNPFKHELWYAYVVGSVVLIGSILAYLYSLRLNSSTSKIFGNLLFWISIGLLIFHLGYMPITIFKNSYPDLTPRDFTGIKKFHIGLIVFMYTSFIIGFLKMRRFKPTNSI